MITFDQPLAPANNKKLGSILQQFDHRKCKLADRYVYVRKASVTNSLHVPLYSEPYDHLFFLPERSGWKFYLYLDFRMG